MKKQNKAPRLVTKKTTVAPRRNDISRKVSPLQRAWVNRALAICLILPFFTAIGVVLFSFFAKLSEANSHRAPTAPLKPDACVNHYAEWYTGRAQIKATALKLRTAPGLPFFLSEGPRGLDESELPSAYNDPNAKHPTFYKAHQVLAWSLRPDQIKRPETITRLAEKFSVTEERIQAEVREMLDEGIPCANAEKPLNWRKLKQALSARLK